MDIQLTANEARVIGCLMEKSVITPDQYPLSLNALANACNQKSSREPVLSLDQNVVLAWALALFWGLAWPWILIALNRRPLRRLIDGLISEVDAAAAGEARRG